MRPSRLLPITLLSGLLGWAPPLSAGQKHGGPSRLKWNRFVPKGLGISVSKPASLTLKRQKKPRHGYLAFTGTERTSGTRFALYVVRASRTAGQLKRDAVRLTGIASGQWLPVLALGATRGFRFLHGQVSRSATGLGTAVLVAQHGKRALSYVVVAQASFGVAMRHLADFRKALAQLKAVP